MDDLSSVQEAINLQILSCASIAGKFHPDRTWNWAQKVNDMSKYQECMNDPKNQQNLLVELLTKLQNSLSSHVSSNQLDFSSEKYMEAFEALINRENLLRLIKNNIPHNEENIE